MAQQIAGNSDDLSLEQIVEGGLCIGCGLCRSIAGAKNIDLVLTPEGRERPVARTPLAPSTVALINAVCPGTRVEGAAPDPQSPEGQQDVVWGPALRLAIGHAGDPEIRYRGSTGGVLTALGQFLLASGRVKFILHVAASKEAPFRTERRLSFDAASVLEGAGSRYGPAAPLLDFASVLDRGEPFALIAKPCDISAVRNLARHDPRVNAYMRCALTLVCGGASDLTKSTDMLDELGIEKDEVTLLRYRGHGNPGPTRIETRDERAFELTYRQMWEDEAKWRIQPRCKICPDAIGEAADLVALDVWPSCNPTGEDEGFNGIIVRTRQGLELYEAALAAGAIAIEAREMSYRDLDLFQPHQVRKKRAVWARFAGMRAAGRPVPRTIGLRVDECARLNALSENLAEARGARERARQGRLGEPSPVDMPLPACGPAPHIMTSRSDG
ncbi:MAG TPA: Coenzyme F420 hydrogenase/dehydrogenase, beta subunit C-terminal domain [Mesorhizobium sp.]|jgi:coenzyme F420 hydrogenase subunit beta|nr:Coenzyme F420 hydrogenase/dehydrogenase, beta subunit C-terminal domain [Mesorhizobium sp.]